MRKPESFANPGSLLRYLRVFRGESQQTVATACDMYPSDVSQFERGNKSMTIERIVRLTNYFGVGIDDLMKDRYDAVLPTLPAAPRRNPKVQKRLTRRQQYRDKLGRAGEAYVAQLEREKLKGTPYANGVNEAYADDLTAGFDVLSFSKDGVKTYIEVKTTGSKVSEPFYLTAREMAFMKFCMENGHRYELHRVFNMGRKKVGRIIYTAEQVLGFHMETATYIVKAVA